MARKLASIVEIESCDPIPDTERLSVATMKGKGWKVVTGRDEFHSGDLAVYFEIDSYLPSEDERYAFLKDRCLKRFVSKSGNVLREGIRIKTIKLRGVISQGLLMPLSAFHEINERIQNGKYLRCTKDEWQKELDEICSKSSEPLDVIPYSESDYLKDVVGSDVTKLLKVEHYDEVKDQLQPLTGSNPISADAMGRFPSDYCHKTDEERIQNLGDWFEKYKDMEWEATAKDDGSSLTMFYSPTIDAEIPFGVCTRNLRIKPELAKGGVPLGYQMAAKYDVENKLKNMFESEGLEYAIQGELVGPGVNADRDKYQEHEWHVFKIYDIKNQMYLLPSKRREVCEKLGLKHVQIISPSIKVFMEYPTMDAVLKFAEGKTARGNEREGIVFKSNTIHNLSFKAVSNRYLMKQDD